MPVWVLSFLIASAPPQAGQWRLESQHTTVRVLSWGSFCGKEPKDARGIPGAMYTLTQQGTDFSLKGAGRLLSTSACSLDPEGYAARQRDQSASGWRVECEAAAVAGNPQVSEHRFEAVSATEIRYVTRGERRKSQALDACRFGYETEMRFVLASEAGPCSVKGAPARLVLDPAARDAAPATRICFKAAALDSNGCEVEAGTVTYSVEPPESAELDGDGCVWTPRTVEGPVVIAVRAESGAAHGGALVRVNPTGEAQPTETITQTVAKSRNERVKQLGSEVLAGAFVIKTPAEEADEAPPPVVVEEKGFPWWLAALALIPMVGAALLLLRKKKPLPAEAPPPVVVHAPSPLPEAAWKCPKCGFEYADPGKCIHDGVALVSKDGMSRKTMFIPQFGGMKCPTCGQKYPSRAKFCGNDRSPLVPDL